MSKVEEYQTATLQRQAGKVECPFCSGSGENSFGRSDCSECRGNGTMRADIVKVKPDCSAEDLIDILTQMGNRSTFGVIYPETLAAEVTLPSGTRIELPVGRMLQALKVGIIEGLKYAERKKETKSNE